MCIYVFGMFELQNGIGRNVFFPSDIVLAGSLRERLAGIRSQVAACTSPRRSINSRDCAKREP